MAVTFHHTLEVVVHLSAGSDENKATAWPFLNIMYQAFSSQSGQYQATIRSPKTEITTLEGTASAADIAKAVAEVTKTDESGCFIAFKESSYDQEKKL
jgi:hypothetical protein